MRTLLTIGLLSLLSACGGARVVGSDNFIKHPIHRIAVSPSGGDVADAIVQRLREKEGGKLEVMGTKATAEMLQRTKVMSIKATTPESLAILKREGIDAWLRMESAAHPSSDTPQNVNVRMTSTHDPLQYIDFLWHNGWGGMRGSLADATMRRGRDDALDAVTDEIVARLAQAITVEP